MSKALEALEKLYEEREYLLGEKVNHKTKNWHNDIKHYDNINKCLLTIKQDLERLEEFEEVLNGHCSKCVNRENNICVGMDAPIHIDTLINCIEMENQELKEENNKLKKALDKACEMLEWGCPVEQDLIDDLDCENCKNTEKECWKKYFLNEVVENEL